MRIGLADDSALFRDGLASLLSASGLQVVLQVASGADLLKEVEPRALDAVVLDIRMPPTFGEEGLDTADALRLRHPTLAVLVLSTYAETAYAVRVFQHGGARRGYLLKDNLDHPPALRAALERLQAGGSVLDSTIVERLMKSTRRKDELGALTEAQRTLLHLLTQGYDDGEIAAAMKLDLPTARRQIDASLRELGIDLSEGSSRPAALLSWLRCEPAV